MKWRWRAAFCAAALIVAHAHTQGIRKSHFEMSQAERDNYISSLNAAHNSDSTLDIIRLMAAAHRDAVDEDNIHSFMDPETYTFLPWHRVFLWELEDALKRQNIFITVPYANWRAESIYSGADSLLNDFLDMQNFSWNLIDARVNEPGTQVHASPEGIQELQDPTTFWNHFDPGNNDYISKSFEMFHNGGHTNLQGDMGGGEAPRDPFFYLHHAMVDKQWQSWEEENGLSLQGYGVNFSSTMPRYDGYTASPYIGTLPAITPQSVIDIRTSMGVFYSDDVLGITKLNGGYEVKNLPSTPSASIETFVYPFTIEVSHFSVPPGKSAFINSNTQIILKPGFVSQGNLVLKVGGYDDNFPSSLTKRPAKDQKPAPNAPPLIPEGVLSVSRLTSALEIQIQINEPATVIAEAFDPRGRLMGTSQLRRVSDPGKKHMVVNLHNDYKGILYLRLKVGTKFYRRIVPSL